jgi:hypothetical protein
VVSCPKPSQPVGLNLAVPSAEPSRRFQLKKEKEKTLNLFEPVLSGTVTNLFDWAKVK